MGPPGLECCSGQLLGHPTEAQRSGFRGEEEAQRKERPFPEHRGREGYEACTDEPGVACLLDA